MSIQRKQQASGAREGEGQPFSPNPMDQKRKVIKLGPVYAGSDEALALPDLDEEDDEDNPHGARCPECGELLCGDPLICIDCDDDKSFGDACKAFYEGGR